MRREPGGSLVVRPDPARTGSMAPHGPGVHSVESQPGGLRNDTSHRYPYPRPGEPPLCHVPTILRVGLPDHRARHDGTAERIALKNLVAEAVDQLVEADTDKRGVAALEDQFSDQDARSGQRGSPSNKAFRGPRRISARSRSLSHVWHRCGSRDAVAT